MTKLVASLREYDTEMPALVERALVVFSKRQPGEADTIPRFFASQGSAGLVFDRSDRGKTIRILRATGWTTQPNPMHPDYKNPVEQRGKIPVWLWELWEDIDKQGEIPGAAKTTAKRAW